MKFYHIADEYITYLRKYDTRVAENKRESRPYVGIVVQIGDINYYAPFTSPKVKHLKMKNGKDFRKIGSGTYRAINFNNMVPVPDHALILIDIANESDEKYKRLLQNQYKAIQADSAAIIRTAQKLRNLILTENTNLSEFDKKIKERCQKSKVIDGSDIGNRLFS